MRNFEASIVSETENGIVRLFFADGPHDERTDDLLSMGEICDALGVSQLNTADVFQLWTKAWQSPSIVDVLRQGYDVNEEDVATFQEELDAMDEVKGLLVFIRSSAFLERPAVIKLEGALNHVASLREPDASVTFKPLPDGGAKGPVQDEPVKKKTTSDAAMGGRVATIALLIMGLLVWLMIKVGG